MSEARRDGDLARDNDPVFRSNKFVSAIQGDGAIDLGDAVPGLRFTAQELFDELSLG